jgi:preprotein translocase subunit SecE
MNLFARAVDYFRSSKAELQKVAWPSRRDTIRYSALVVAVSVIVAVFFALLDSGLGKAVEIILSRQTSAQQPAPAPTEPVVPTLTPDVQAVTPNGAPATFKVTPVDTNNPIK